MSFCDYLPSNRVPWILFRADYKTKFQRNYLFAQETKYNSVPTRQELDYHLMWEHTQTRFLSFSADWRRVMDKRKRLEDSAQGKEDVVVIAVWAKDLFGVFDAEEVASRLGYSDTGGDIRRQLWHHCDEYLVEGGIPADEYRILAVFEGGGPDRYVVFSGEPNVPYEWPAIIPSEFFPGIRSSSALKDIGEEIYCNTGVYNDIKRDQLVKAICGRHPMFPKIEYKEH